MPVPRVFALTIALLATSPVWADPMPVSSLKEGPVEVRGVVKAATPANAPLSGTPAAIARTHAKLTKDDGSHTVGPKEGKKLTAAEFQIDDGTGSATVFATEAKYEQVRWEPDAWQHEVVRAGRKMTEEGQRAIRAMMKEPEAMGLFATTGEVTVRETVVAPGQEVVVRGFYRTTPRPGIYATDAHPIVITISGDGGAGGGGRSWIVVAALLLAGGAALFFLKRRR